MYARYPLFHSHLDLAHKQWQLIVRPGDIVIDATCGNGHDSLVLARLALTEESGSLIAIDLQQEAIDAAKERLARELTSAQFSRVEFHIGCHSSFPGHLIPSTVKLAAYNLGYLPGGDKKVTTLSQSTLMSIQNAMELIQDGGLISIACYPGHSAGKVEEGDILNFLEGLDPKGWSACHMRWMNRKNSPSLVLLQKPI